MFTNALVGVDGRPGGRDAISLAQHLTSPEGRITLAHMHTGRVHPLHAITPGQVAEERQASTKLLEDERSAAEVEAELLSIEAATPGAGLHREAEERGVDLLVVGSCSRGLLGRAMLGDDTRGALNGAPCAVAVAARGYAEAPLPLAKIGVAYNGSPESRAALRAAIDLASANRADVLALEVVSIPTYAFTGLVPPAYGETVDLMLSEANERVGELDGAQGRAVYGLAGEELATFSDEVDLLVVGSRSYGPVKRLVLGSTTDYLERHARCSLLVMPRGVGAAEPGETAETAAVGG
jgi:nucleotide-binding universal stress UspA family protein